jgi:primary-amine oxidase
MGASVGGPLAALLLWVLCLMPEAAAHPLDPLSRDEIATAVAVLRAAGRADDATRFALIDLAEPAKAAVMRWRPGEAEFRRAFVVARRDRQVYEAVVDLAARTVESWRRIPGVQSALTPEEWREAARIVRADPGWQAAMRRRGYQALDRVACQPLAAGSRGGGRRLLHVACFEADADGNLWSRPIEGLIAVVDLDAARVIRLIDTGAVPIAPADSRWGEGAQPARDAAPAAHGFTVSGSEVRWRNWSFHYRMDRRAGPIVSLLRYADHGRERLVLYRGSLAEMVVPYMDASPAWAFRNFLDEGEWGLGLASSPLAPGIDCPADAAFLDAVLAGDHGEALTGKSVVCLFERATGDPLWRHFETATGAYRGRAAVELVLRSIASLGNYDYIVDWVLGEAGTVRIAVGATGIDAVKGVRARTMGDASAAAETVSGDLVAANRVGVDHDHFVSFRLDLDIDGTANTLVRRRLVRDRAAGRSRWRAADEPVPSEGPLGTDIWRIVNPRLTNALGRHPGYELHLPHGPDDPGQRRAGFAAAPLWVTAYDPGELYAAGDYPNQGSGGDGLPAYAARHRPVENADIVLWCTIGFHHLPRPEDWPVLPVMWRGLSLVPDAFFDRNPTQ